MKFPGVKLISAIALGLALAGCGVMEPQEEKTAAQSDEMREVHQTVCATYSPNTFSTATYSPATYRPTSPGVCPVGYTWRTDWNGWDTCVRDCPLGYTPMFDWNNVDTCARDCSRGSLQYDWNGTTDLCVDDCRAGYTLTRDYPTSGGLLDVCKATNC